MKVILVDDEPKAISLLRSYLDHFSELEVVGSFRNGLKAFEYINQHEVDLVFLDINMPDLSGISLSKMVSDQVMIVFTTAYSEYAVESYEVDAVDYLLKPISLDRFMQCMQKILSKQSASEPKEGLTTLWIKSGSEHKKVEVEDLLYLEKDGNYITYYTLSRKVMTRASIAEALEQLPEHFVQIHKSYIVNLKKVDSQSPAELKIGELTIPIGNAFRNNFERR